MVMTTARRERWRFCRAERIYEADRKIQPHEGKYGTEKQPQETQPQASCCH